MSTWTGCVVCGSPEVSVVLTWHLSEAQLARLLATPAIPGAQMLLGPAVPEGHPRTVKARVCGDCSAIGPKMVAELILMRLVIPANNPNTSPEETK